MTISARTFAIVSAGLAAALAAAPSGAADTYQADAVHSSLVFRVKHMNTSFFWGRFNNISGSFTLDGPQPNLNFQVKAASVDTANAGRDSHLKGPDFFNAVQFPTIAFTSKSVVKSGNVYEVSGDLTLHGVTRPVSFRVTPTGTGRDMRGNAIAGIETNFTIKQSDFGITKMAAAIGDEVWVNVSVEGAKK